MLSTLAQGFTGEALCLTQGIELLPSCRLGGSKVKDSLVTAQTSGDLALIPAQKWLILLGRITQDMLRMCWAWRPMKDQGFTVSPSPQPKV